MKCDNLNNGCKWIGELNSLPEHLSYKCSYNLVQCPFKCSEKMLKRELEAHKKLKCPNRIVSCEHCKEKGPAIRITTAHLKTCPNVKIDCPNDGCNAKFPRCELLEHRYICSYEKKICRYHNIGCEEVLYRKDLDAHESNAELHLGMAIGTISELRTAVSSLKTVVSMHDSMLRSLQNVAQAKLPQFTFQMPHFSEHKKNNTKFHIPPFYSHPGGYKLSSTIYANGQGDCAGKSISLYMFFNHGENDSDLSWPFLGSCTIELLNQLGDYNHHTNTLVYGKGRMFEVNNRVTCERGVAEIGSGFNSFIDFTELEHEPGLNYQYLKDDCLFFRFTVHPPKHPRPWLTCTQ